MNFGIADSIMNGMKNKVSHTSENDRWCTWMVDDIEMYSSKDFDTSEKHFVGGVTLGSKSADGKHYTVVLARGLKKKWKQVIAHEVTGPTTSGQDMCNLIFR